LRTINKIDQTKDQSRWQNDYVKYTCEV